jgi:hypothetical protein
MLASTDRRLLRVLAALWLVLAATHCAHIAQRLTASDSRDVALSAILNHTAPTDRLGMIWEPWFQSPPLDFCNGGAGLRQSPFWSHFEAPRRPLVIVGYDAARLRAERPQWVVTSCVETRDYIRAHAAPYHRVSEWGTGYSDGLVPSSLDPPQDWLYPTMQVYLLQRRN